MKLSDDELKAKAQEANKTGSQVGDPTDPENPTKAELASSVIDLWLSALEAITHALEETGELINKAAEVNHGSQLSEKWLTERYERLKAERKAGGAEDISG